MKKTFNSESIQSKLFNAQRSTFKCEPPVVVALRGDGRARVFAIHAPRLAERERLQLRRSARIWKHLLNKHSASDYFAHARPFLSHHRRGDHFLPAVRASALRSETDSRPFRLAPELDLRG